MIKEDLFSIQFIDIVSVENSSPISNFSTNEIESLANNYLECGGNINPIIVERTGLDEYKVIKGDLELYAAKKAKEKDKFFEMIRAIILNKKNELVVSEQINLLEKTVIPPPVSDIGSNLARLENSILAKIDLLNRKIDHASNSNVIQHNEDLENSILAKLDKLLTTKFETLKKEFLESKITSAKTEVNLNEVDLNKLNITRLKAIAKERGIRGYSKFKQENKLELIDKIMVAWQSS